MGETTASPGGGAVVPPIGDPCSIGAEDSVAVADMQLLVAAGEALPLLVEFDIGPVWWGGCWWAVPEGRMDLGYIPAGPDWQISLSTAWVRLEVADATVKEITADRRRDEARRAAAWQT